jgi:hypothetical protein
MFAHTVEGFERVAEHNPQMRVGIEYKPWEPSRSVVGRLRRAVVGE